MCNFRLAVTPRVKDGDGWKDGDTSFFRITAWRQLAEHVGDSLVQGRPGDRPGQLRSRAWETPKATSARWSRSPQKRSVPALRWATAKPEQALKANGKPAGQFNDDPPF